MYHSIAGISFPGHLSLFLWKITQNNLKVLIISDFWAWLDWRNLWRNLMPYCWIIVRIQISLKAVKVSDKIKKLVDTKWSLTKAVMSWWCHLSLKKKWKHPPSWIRHFELFKCTVGSLLTDTSIRRTPLYNGHLELVLAFLYSLYLTFYKMDS